MFGVFLVLVCVIHGLGTFWATLEILEQLEMQNCADFSEFRYG